MLSAPNRDALPKYQTNSRSDLDINNFLNAVGTGNLHDDGTTEHPLPHRIGEEFHDIVLFCEKPDIRVLLLSFTMIESLGHR